MAALSSTINASIASNEYIVDSYQEGHAAGVDGTCIYCGYLVVDHNAIRLLYTESGFSVGGTSEFILTITNTTDYTVYGGCSAYYNDGTGSGTPADMFSGDICYRSNLGTIQRFSRVNKRSSASMQRFPTHGWIQAISTFPSAAHMPIRMEKAIFVLSR